MALLGKNLIEFADVRDESNRSVALLNQRENGLVTWSTLVAITTNLFGTELPPSVVEYLGKLSTCSRADARALLADIYEELAELFRVRITSARPGHNLEPWLDGVRNARSPEGALAEILALWASISRGFPRKRRLFEQFHRMLVDFAFNFIMLIPVEQEPLRRRILKYSFEVPVPWEPQLRQSIGLSQRPGTFRSRLGWQPQPFGFVIPNVSYGQSYHFQLHAPSRLAIARAELQLDPSHLHSNAVVTEDTAHLQISSAPPTTRAVAFVWLRPPARGLVRHAAWAGIAVTCLLWLGVIFARRLQFAAQAAPDSITAILLTLGILSLFIAQPGQHTLASRLLFSLRTQLVLLTALCLAAALLILSGQALARLRLALFVLACGSSLIALSLGVAYASAKRDVPVPLETGPMKEGMLFGHSH